MRNNKSRYISLLIFIIPVVMCIVAYPHLPQVIGTHFDFSGNVNGTMDKFLGTFGVLAVMFLLQCVMVFFVPKDPKYKNIGGAMQALTFYSVPVISTIVLAAILAINLGYSISINTITGTMVGLLFIGLGNYLPKTKRNYTVGIKLPWTLDDDDNWNKTHRLGGYCFIISGFALLLTGFINQLGIGLTVTFALMIVPAIYSYLLYQKKAK